MSDSAPINEHSSSSSMILNPIAHTISASGSPSRIPQRKLSGSTHASSDHAEQSFNIFVFLSKNKILLALFAVGVLTGMVNGLAIWLVAVGSKAQARLLMDYDNGPLYFIITTTAFCALSALITKTGGLAATFGSGMPEVKTLLVNDFLPHEFTLLVSPKILALRLFSNVTAVMSGLAIGMAGPLVHVAVSTAYCVVHYIPFFKELEENPAVMKQIFAASAAVGLTTVFNAPVGGLLFSVEVTSTYYLISNYWRSFMVSTIGAVMYAIVLKGRGDSYRLYRVPTNLDPYESWEFIMFALIGVVTGVMSYVYLNMHQRWFLFVKPYVTKHPIITTAAGGAVSALMIWLVGAYSMKGVTGGVIVHDLFQKGLISELNTYDNVSPIGGLIAALLVRVLLTLLGTTLRISAGVFVPMLTLGALIGRIYGQILQDMVTEKGLIYLGGYAMVGAAGMVSGTTHTISAALIVVELTGELDMMVPCLIAAVVSSGITKLISLSLYDQGMVNKGLESFELLMKSGGSYHSAGDIMDPGCIHVTNKCVIYDLVTLLEDEKRQSIFPLVSDDEARVLQGSLSRREIFLFVRRIFEKQQLMANLQKLLPLDCEKEDQRRARARQQALMKNNPNSMSKVLWRSVSLDKEQGDTEGGFLSRIGNNRPTFGSFSSDKDEGGVKVASEDSRIDDGDGENPDSSMSQGVKWFSNLSSDLQAALALSPPPSTTSASSMPGNTVQTPAEAAECQKRVDFILDMKVNLAEEATLPINGFPYTASFNTTMDQLYVLFEMVHVSCVFVVGEGKSLQGIISKKAVLKNMKNKSNVAAAPAK
ncbi:chloride channel [Ochromonadaceae sp. CCMP2298]|nr:chloride channel [Ochromonadaceae sp. CCMP2298]